MSVVVKRYRPSQFREADLMLAKRHPTKAPATNSRQPSTAPAKKSPPVKS